MLEVPRCEHVAVLASVAAGGRYMAAAEESLYLLAVIKPRMERAAEAKTALRALVAGTLQEPGNVYMEFTVDHDDPTTWYMFEKFTSRQAWEEHMLTPHVVLGNAALADLLREPTELRFFSPN
jgi:quinol monooxygenase YgiN